MPKKAFFGNFHDFRKSRKIEVTPETELNKWLMSIIEFILRKLSSHFNSVLDFSLMQLKMKLKM